jgi:hypothetical protein
MRALFLAPLIAASFFSTAWAQLQQFEPYLNKGQSGDGVQIINTPQGPQLEACRTHCTEPYIPHRQGYTGDEENPAGDSQTYREMNPDTDPVNESDSAAEEGGPAGE